MATQRDYERDIWTSLLAHLAGMPFDELCQEVGIDEEFLTDAQADRLSKAADRVQSIIYRHTGGA
jgi:hypothetical protein